MDLEACSPQQRRRTKFGCGIVTESEKFGLIDKHSQMEKVAKLIQRNSKREKDARI